jgi:N-acetylglutamate synthase-like GNAT family acetyltransferase
MLLIRKAVKKDVPRLIELYEDLIEDKIEISPETLKRVFAEIESMPRHYLLVAVDEGLVVGTVDLQIVPHLSHNARPWGIIENMVVDKSCRRQGAGRHLIEKVAELCREAGCYKVQLLSNNKRLQAHRFYSSVGFENSAQGFRMYFH